MAPLPEGVTYGQWLAVYNALSFGIAAMGSCMIFVWLQMPNVKKQYRTALAITGLVVAIATYHYVRIFNSWNAAFDVTNGGKGPYEVSLTGAPFNDAYRYVDWLLTVPLLLIELILVMGLPAAETASLSWKLGLSSALMVALGYPGEIQEDNAQRWIWWAMAMVPFCYVVNTLLVGLSDATEKQPEAAKGLIVKARYLTAISWLTYPGVYIIKMVGLSGAFASCAEQIGYSVSDVTAKAVFGILIWAIAAAKSEDEPLATKAIEGA
jgi:bacteriorhodopsin